MGDGHVIIKVGGEHALGEPVRLSVNANPKMTNFKIGVIVNGNLGHFSGKTLTIKTPPVGNSKKANHGENAGWEALVPADKASLEWRIRKPRKVKMTLGRMGVNTDEMTKAIKFERAFAIPEDPKQHERREFFEVIHMGRAIADAGNGVKLEFILDKLTIEEGHQVRRHSHDKNVVFEIYFYLEDSFEADICWYDERHESRRGMRHVLALKMLVSTNE